MGNEDMLSEVLSEFARTLLTDFPIQRILDHLVERIVDVLPISAAGVTLISPGIPPHYIAASDKSALEFERLQTRLGEGPCLLAYESGDAVAVPNLADEQRFPLFAPAALDAGLMAVFTFPLRHTGGRLGALDLYREVSGDLDDEEMAAAQTLADVTAAYLLNAWAHEADRATADRLYESSLHDPLTGLPNRLLLNERLAHAAQRAKRTHAAAAILFADLDKFKEVNDEHGHQVGDDLLIAVAKRLTSVLRPGDTLARISGDEFVFLCEDLRSAADVKVVTDRIDAAFSDPFLLGDLSLSVTASVGIAFAGSGEDVSEQVVSRADAAMYRVKRKRRTGNDIIDIRESLESDDTSTLEQDLARALVSDEFDVEYLPVVRSADGVVTGVDAQLQWTHPDRGVMPASVASDLAERSGLANELGAWTLDRCCRDHVRWMDANPNWKLSIAVNVSARQVMTPNFTKSVGNVLTTTGMDPTALILEMTENIFVENGERLITVLGDLRQLGIRLSLDHFGTGYSSLSYLRSVPVEFVKIDRSFTADINDAPGATAVVGAIADLAHALGLEVIADGVDTKKQHHEVCAVGCDYTQGVIHGGAQSPLEFGARFVDAPSVLSAALRPAS